jgi:hypothetical protein
MDGHTRYTHQAYNGIVAEPCTLLDGIQHEATAEDAAKLEEYFRGKLDLAVSLACQGEQERRSGHRASAEEYQRQWEQVIAEIKRLLPLVRKSSVSLFPTAKHQPSRSRKKGR